MNIFSQDSDTKELRELERSRNDLNEALDSSRREIIYLNIEVAKGKMAKKELKTMKEDLRTLNDKLAQW